MKANELRIGNLITFLGETIEVECISNLPKRKDMYWIKPKGSLIAKEMHFRPIPLTEEWLLNFEFERLPNTMTCNYSSKCGSVSVFKMPNGKIFADGFFKDVKLESVHQLQNLYFALTGEELSC
jgi:hypothetical protein